MNINKLWKKIRHELAVVRRLYRDDRTSWIVKALSWVAVGYAIWWFDPLIGPLDDIIIVGGCIWLAYRLTPKSLLSEIRTVVLKESANRNIEIDKI